MHSQYFTGLNQYCSEFLPSLSGLMANIHRLLTYTAEKYSHKAPIKTCVYGASATGLLTELIMREYEEFKFYGFIDQKGKILEKKNFDLGITWKRSKPVFELNDAPVAELDLIICATAPVFYKEIADNIATTRSDLPVVFLHKNGKFQCIVPTQTLDTPLIIATTGRCGTVSLRNMLWFLLPPLGFQQVIISSTLSSPEAQSTNRPVMQINYDLLERLQPGDFAIDHFQLTETLKEKIKKGLLKAIFLYRDPRDVQVSNSFYFHEKFIFEHGTIQYIIKMIKEWQSLKEVLLIRYEDLIDNPVTTLQRISQFCAIKTDKNLIEEIANAISFKHLSGGRLPGEENRSHHYRKGIAGDWKNHYRADHKRKVKELYGQDLIAIGYETDLNW